MLHHDCFHLLSMKPFLHSAELARLRCNSKLMCRFCGSTHQWIIFCGCTGFHVDLKGTSGPGPQKTHHLSTCINQERQCFRLSRVCYPGFCLEMTFCALFTVSWPPLVTGHIHLKRGPETGAAQEYPTPSSPTSSPGELVLTTWSSEQGNSLHYRTINACKGNPYLDSLKIHTQINKAPKS